MTALDEIKEHIAYQLSYWEDEPSVIHMRLSAVIVSEDGKVEERAEVPLITCKDCKHGHMTTDGEHCKWCSIMATHQIDSDEDVDPPNGYDPEPYFDADFFCGFAERRDA